MNSDWRNSAIPQISIVFPKANGLISIHLKISRVFIPNKSIMASQNISQSPERVSVQTTETGHVPGKKRIHNVFV